MIKNLLLGCVFITSIQTYFAQSIDCATYIQHGSQKQGRSINSYNWLSADVNFDELGTYVFSTDTVNGLYFNDTLIVTEIGLKNVRLKGFGTPISAGTHVYTLNNACAISVYTQSSACRFVSLGGSYANINCTDDSSGSILIKPNYSTGTAPFNFHWASGHGDTAYIDGLVSKLYQVTVYDADSCNFSHDVTPSPAPGATLGVMDTVYTVCLGDSVTLSAYSSVRKYDFNWYDQSGALVKHDDDFYSSMSELTVYPTESTIYSLTESWNCESLEPIFIRVEVINKPSVPVSDSGLVFEVYAIERGEEITLSASCTGEVMWFLDTTDLTTPIFVGTDFLVAPQVNTNYYAYCSNGTCLGGSFAEFVVLVSDPEPNPLQDQNIIICEGERAIVFVTGVTGEVRWFTQPNTNGNPVHVGMPYIVENVTEDFTLFAFTHNGTSYNPDFTPVHVLTLDAAAKPTATQTNYLICQGETVDLLVSSVGATSIEWFLNANGTGEPIATGNSVSITPAAAMSFYVFANNASNCLSAPLQINVLVQTAPNFMQDTIEEIACHDEVLTLTMDVPSSVVVEWYSSVDRTPGTLLFTGNPFVVNPEPVTTDPIETVEYFGFARTSNGVCYSDHFTYVEVILLSELSVPVGQNDYYICAGESITMLATSSSVGSICWFNVNPPQMQGLLMMADTFTVAPTTTTTYYAYDEYSIGCLSDALPVTVHVDENCDPAVEPGSPTTKVVHVMPSIQVFTPNNDGVEDVIEIGTVDMKTYKVEIFNMRGQLVRVMDRFAAGWDGRDANGVIQPNGYYVYVLDADGVSEKRMIGLAK